ncbi:hypothetical protein PACTADRAFT_21284, partial [Pachysolen tannophilus NRRL Y-2460]
MSSTIFYRFKCQKELSKIFFDGTGITVFDLKREIINVNKLGVGTDFDLRLYNPDTEEEYDDDTQIISRSSVVIARRSPPQRHGKGNASRYVTGKPRILRNNNNISNIQQQQQQQQQQQLQLQMQQQLPIVSTSNNVDQSGVNEDDKIQNFFSQQDVAWKNEQEVLQNQEVYHFQRSNNNNNNKQEDAPPPGYICYRCGAKDHWIKNCPTNNDPNWEGKRIKRTTGIPKSYLKTIERPSELSNEDSANLNYMVTEDGKYVVALADKKSWENYQKKSQLSTKLLYNSDTIKDSSLLDPITHTLFDNPVDTPCCHTTYSRLSIENSLLDTDFKCPNCGKEDILLDSLVENKEVNDKVDNFLEE